jgi:MinD-like ATPase involved in chromosome partitioning or flagellar assembly
MMLARAGRRVGIIDLDLEAPGAGVLVPAAEPPRYGVVDYLLERRVLAGRDLDIADYYYLADTPEIVGNGPAITVVPAGRLDSDYLEKLARVDYDALLGGAEEPPLHALLRQMKADRELDYILIDSRAGLHDIGGLALNGVAHLDVIFGTATEQSWQGVTVVVEHLGKKRLQAKVQRQDCALVYALAPSVAEKNRGEAVELFRSRAHEIFSDYFYDEEVEAGQPEPEDYWPVPSVDSDDEPHHAVPIGFNIDIMRGESLAAVAPQLLQGDYEMLHKALLARLGRMAP